MRRLTIRPQHQHQHLRLGKTLKNASRLYVAVLAISFLVACGQFKLFSPTCVGAGCTASSQNGAPSPSATPTATPTPTPGSETDCRIGYLAFDKGPTSLAQDQSGEFEFSPWQSVLKDGKLVNVKVADECNTGSRSALIKWAASTVAGVIVVAENPYSAKVTRKGTGSFDVTVTLEGHIITRTVTQAN